MTSKVEWCEDHEWPGYYADVENDCQVFHICVDRITRMDKFSFLCPPETIFNQELLVCVWPTDFDCQSSPSFYRVNELLYRDQYKELQRNSRLKFDEGKDFSGNDLNNQLHSSRNEQLEEIEKIVLDYNDQWPKPNLYENNLNIKIPGQSNEENDVEYLIQDKLTYTNPRRTNEFVNTKGLVEEEFEPLQIKSVPDSSLKQISDVGNQMNTHSLKLDRNSNLNAIGDSKKSDQHNLLKQDLPNSEQSGWPALPDLRKKKNTDMEAAIIEKDKNRLEDAIHNTNNNFFLISDKPDQIIITVNDKHKLSNRPFRIENSFVNNLRKPSLEDNKFDGSDSPLTNPIHFSIDEEFNRDITHKDDYKFPFDDDNKERITLNINYDSHSNSFTSLGNEEERIHPDKLKILTCISYKDVNGQPHCQMEISPVEEVEDFGLRTTMENPNIILKHSQEELLEDLNDLNSISNHADDFTDEELSALILNRLNNINNHFSHSLPERSPLSQIDQRDEDSIINEQRRNLVLDDLELDYEDPERISIDPISFSGFSNEIQPTKIIRNERGQSSSKPIVHSLGFEDDLSNVIVIHNITDSLQQSLPSGLKLPTSEKDISQSNLKSPLVIVSRAEAEENELNQKRVYINTILPDDFDLNLISPPIKQERYDQPRTQNLYSLPDDTPSRYGEDLRRDRFKYSIDDDYLNEEIERVQNFQFLRKSIVK